MKFFAIVTATLIATVAASPVTEQSSEFLPKIKRVILKLW